ncbi:MAG: phosphoribosylformylglycinamidine synthase subunit PurS [Eggerthellaceae bacterium]|jgi:phosphoribosylformylglycinamidine synthase PurS subunit
MKTFKIFVTGKEGIFDPAGQQSMNALQNLGFSGVLGVSIDKMIQLDAEDSVTREDVRQMCEKLLANPVIEDYEIVEE